jgi:hypothetical protein
VDLPVVVILDLHDLVAGTEGPAEPLDADLAGRVQRFLQLDIERAGAEAATVHRAEHLDVSYRVEPEAAIRPRGGANASRVMSITGGAGYRFTLKCLYFRGDTNSAILRRPSPVGSPSHRGRFGVAQAGQTDDAALITTRNLANVGLERSPAG